MDILIPKIYKGVTIKLPAAPQEYFCWRKLSILLVAKGSMLL